MLQRRLTAEVSRVSKVTLCVLLEIPPALNPFRVSAHTHTPGA